MGLEYFINLTTCYINTNCNTVKNIGIKNIQTHIIVLDKQ